MAEQFWRLRRARAIETGLLDSDQVLIPHLAAIQRMMSSAERGFHKALTVLRQLQKDRGLLPQKQQCGFVPAKSQPVGQTVLPSAASALGFVPPSCPEGEDIDPADWARAFQHRHAVWTKTAETEPSRSGAPHTPVVRKPGA